MKIYEVDGRFYVLFGGTYYPAISLEFAKILHDCLKGGDLNFFGGSASRYGLDEDNLGENLA